MEGSGFSCPVCGVNFTEKSNMTRHKLIHQDPALKCEDCGQTFRLKQTLSKHMRQHEYPNIRMYGALDALIKETLEGLAYKKKKDKNIVEPAWLEPVTAEAKAKLFAADEELWRGQIKLTWGQYEGQTFKFLIENDVGYVRWMLSE